MPGDKDTTIQELKDLLKDFRDRRDWAQFHQPKDLAEAITVEAGELLELFLWQTKDQVAEKFNDPDFKKKAGEELADVIIFCLNFANAADLDVATAIRDKLAANDKKYPVEKAKGNAKKYDQL